MGHSGVRFATTCFIALIACQTANGQWVQQQFSLVAGWNSVYLQVDPSPEEADSLWAAQPIAAVWTRSADLIAAISASTCNNPDDPTCIPPEDTGWRVWLPPTSPHAVTSSLRVIRGGRVYLIRANSPFVWTVTGRPSGAPTRWSVGANLVGFHVVTEPASTPTFASYLAPFLTVTAQSVFDPRADGSLQAISTPGSTRITPGKGYWVKSSRAGSYDGPVDIDRGSLRGIDFARSLSEHAVTLGNRAAAPRTLTLERIASAPVPTVPPGLPQTAGPVPLRWLDYDTHAGNEPFPWQTLTSQSFSFTSSGQAASRRSVRIAVDRAGLSAAELDADGHGSQYQSILSVTDGNGFLRRFAVAAQVPGGPDSQTAGAGDGDPQPGLYVGLITVNAVSWVTAGARQWMNDDPVNPVIIPGQPDDVATPRPTSSEFSMPVILHVSGDGRHRLLHEVTMMWQPEAPPARPEGRFVLVSPECPPETLSTLRPAALRDGEPAARRLNTAGFVFLNAQGQEIDLNLTGSLFAGLTASTSLPANHRLNPFRHLYHPDHDCNEAGECFDIVRSLSFAPAAQPGPGEFRPGFGESFFTGTFAETITGLHRGPVQVRGTYQLTRVSRIATLNAQ